MIEHAKEADPTGDYRLIRSGHIDLPAETFDLALSSFVLLEVPSKETLEDIYKEVSRVLKPRGLFLIVTVSPTFFEMERSWVSYEPLAVEKGDYADGMKIRFKIREIGIELSDFLWKRETMKSVANEAGFDRFRIHSVYGSDADAFEWKDEQTHSPFDILVCRKSMNR